MKIKGDLLFGLVLSMSAFTASATILGNIAITPNSPATTKENVDRLTLESIESYVDLNKSMTLFNGADSIGSGESSLGGIVGLDVVSIEDSIQAAKDAADDAAADASVAQVTANSADTKATSANNLTSSLTTSKVVGGSCSPNGSLSKTSTGELLVCQGGSWQSSPDEYARKLALNPLLIYPNFTLACNTAGTAYQGRGRLEMTDGYARWKIDYYRSGVYKGTSGWHDHANTYATVYYGSRYASISVTPPRLKSGAPQPVTAYIRTHGGTEFACSRTFNP